MRFSAGRVRRIAGTKRIPPGGSSQFSLTMSSSALPTALYGTRQVGGGEGVRRGHI